MTKGYLDVILKKRIWETESCDMVDFDEKAVVEKWNITNERQEEFWFMLFRQGDLRKIWKPQIEIIFILKGTGKIYFANMKTVYTVQEEDIFVINCYAGRLCRKRSACGGLL